MLQGTLPGTISYGSRAQHSTAWLLDRWQTMLTIRLAEEAIARMVESGEARCPCHLYIGQEAIAAGVCAALAPDDLVWGGHRSHGHYLAKGGSLEGLFAEVLGRVSGCSGGRGGSMHLLARDIGILGTVPIVAGTIPLAVGAAFAAKSGFSRIPVSSRISISTNGSRRPPVSVAFFGDGALEEGHVHESMNLAALYRLPVIFICENNFYSSHMHWSERRVCDNLHRAGEFHGVAGERVDGNDVEAVHQAARRAVERASQAGEPTLLECRTFRWRGHVGASLDADVGVRRRGELAEWIEKDPLRIVENRLRERSVPAGDASLLDARKSEVQNAIEAALMAARAAPAPDPGRLLEGVWSALGEEQDRELEGFPQTKTPPTNSPLHREAACGY